jgi:hypothetical protein
VDQILKGIQISENQKSLRSIDFNHRKKESDENLKDQKTTKIIGVDQIITLKKNLSESNKSTSYDTTQRP